VPASLLYFAYGSNMLSARLAARVGRVRLVGPAWLAGYRLVFHKRGADGSAKCDIVAGDHSALVHGVVFGMDEDQRARLDGFEGPGYRASGVELRVPGAGEPLPAIAYLARPEYVQAGLRPYDWYKALVVAGARHHRLPEDYVAAIEAVDAMADPDPARERRNRIDLDSD